MAKVSGKGLLVIALVLSVITSGLVYKYLKGVTTDAVKPGVPVIVAKIGIPAKTVMTADMVKVVNVPPEYIQPGAVQGLDQVVGVVVREAMLVGEQITERRLLVAGKFNGFSGIIPQNKVALTIAVTEVTGVAGFVKAGDRVDVLVTFDQNSAGSNVSQMFLQDIQVLASNRDAEGLSNDSTGKDKKEAPKISTVTVAVNAVEATQLTLAEEKGKIRLALKPYLPNSEIVVTTAVTPRDLVGMQVPLVKNNDSSSNSEPRRNTDETPKASVREGKGIQLIRGTKTEIIPVQ